MDSANLDDWLAWQLGVSPHDMDLKLKRVQDVLGRMALSLPETIITVAGTNGKGSTVATLEAILGATGHRVGCYTSPHLQRYNERIRIDRALASDEDIVRAFQAIETVRGGEKLTFFEFGTLAAIWLFCDHAVDVAVLEVGLGGRLDAVNAVDASGVVITSIAMDHQDWLGDNLQAIAAEKAGVMRAGRPAVFAGRDMPTAIARVATDTGANLLIAGQDFGVTRHKKTWDWQSQKLAFADLPLPGIAGDHQFANVSGALAILAELDLINDTSQPLVAVAIAALGLPARYQRIGQDPQWIIDVAHNPAATSALAETLRGDPVPGTTFALCGMLEDKDVAGSIQNLINQVGVWLAVGISEKRGLDATKLGTIIANTTGEPCRVMESLDSALEVLTGLAGPGDRVVVFGSFYLAGPVLDRLHI